MGTKLSSGSVKLKPLVAATLRRARRFTRRRSPSPPAAAISSPPTKTHTTDTPTTDTPTTDTPITDTPSANTPSLFLTLLPAEIRERIYHFVFAGKEILLALPQNRHYKLEWMQGICHWEIGTGYGNGKWWALWHSEVVREYPAYNQDIRFEQEPVLTGNLLGLALCCHQVHAESIKFLYASPGFTVLRPFVLNRFVEASQGRVDFMRWVRVMRLEFEFKAPVFAGDFSRPDEPGALDHGGVCWDETCRALGMMTGLRLLHVTLCPSKELMGRHWVDEMVWEMLELLRMARANEFRVSVPRPFMKFEEMLADAPFELYQIYEDPVG
ncbi:hypothetical protein V492_00090 [Pseudogymnoascus sp. VKM F-4246]|nr:hypothetical protein V492_00090 [Pseudogymnoascus sp. VKM F-4246]